MFALFAAIVLLSPAIAPPPKPDGPVLRFIGPADAGGLTFELSNPGTESLKYAGYESDSFSGGLAKGTISPVYRLEVLRDKEWKPVPMGWCGTGRGPVSVPAKAKATFTVHPPAGEWDRFRVGVTWFQTADRKDPAAVWSDGLRKEDLTRKKP